MNTLPLEIIFDYACPYCYRAHLYLKEIREEFAELEMEFKPCEAHPRPEQWSPHSDLALKGMYYCMEHEIDVWKYHDKIYKAYHVDHIDAESIDVLADYLADLVDPAEFKAVVNSDRYEEQRVAANQYAWGTLSLNAVPSYLMGGQVLKAVENIGVSKQMLLRFMEGN